MKKLFLASLLTFGGAFSLTAQNVGVDVASPQQKLDVAGGIRIGTTSSALLGTLRMNGTVLEYHNGTAWIQMSANTDDQQVDQFTLSGNTLSLSLEDDGQAPQTISLASYLDNTDDQTIDVFSISGNSLQLSLESDGQATQTVSLAPYLDNTDDQTIDAFSLSGTTLNLSLESDGQATQTLDLDPLRRLLIDADDDTKVEVEASPDEDAIRFTTDGTERIRVLSNGKVGIGTAAPGSRLTVHGTESDTEPILSLTSGNQQNGFNNGAQIAFGYDGDNEYMHFIQTRHNQGTAANNAIDLYVSNGTTANNTVTSGSIHVMSLNAGNVGIGITTPTQKLHVSGTGRFTSLATPGNSIVYADVNGDLYASTSNVNANSLVDGAGTLNYLSRWTPDGNSLGIGATYDNGINVGIGTTTPAQKLSVAGAINSVLSGETVDINTDGNNPSIELRDGDGTGLTPFIDFSNDGASDFDGRIRLTGDDYFAVEGANLGIGTTAPAQSLHVAGTGRFTSLATPGNSIVYADANGDLFASTSSVNANSLVDGDGTLNYLARWTPDGNSLGIGATYDNGTNVGIGTSSPGFKLHVVGDFHTAGKIVVQNSVDGGSTRGIWMWNGGDSNWGVYMGQSGAGRSLSGGTAVGGGGFTAHAIRTRVNNSDSQGIIFENSAESLLFSVRGGDGQAYHKGNVGINTDPSAKLHILVTNDQNDNPANNGIYVQNNDNSGDNGDAIITTRVAGAGGGDPFFSMDVNGVTGWSMGLDNSDGDKLKFANNWSNPGLDTRMTIQTDGNVGIGTSTPSNKLEVIGNGRFGTSANNYIYTASGAVAGAGGLEIFTTGNVGYIRYHDPGVAWRNISLNDAGGNVGIGTTGPVYKLDVNGNTRVSGGLYTEGTASTLYGTNASIYANNANVSGGGIMISDDGGFFDYNNGPVTFNGSTGLVIAGNSGASSSNGYLRINQLGGTGTRDVYADGNGTLVIKPANSNVATYEQRSAVYMDNANSGYRVVGGSTNALSVQTGDKVIIMVTHKFWWTGGSGGDHELYGLRVTGACGTLNYYESYKNGTSDDVPRNQEQSLAHQFIWTATCNGNVQFSLLCDNNSQADDNSYLGDIVVVATRQ